MMAANWRDWLKEFVLGSYKNSEFGPHKKSSPPMEGLLL